MSLDLRRNDSQSSRSSGVVALALAKLLESKSCCLEFLDLVEYNIDIRVIPRHANATSQYLVEYGNIRARHANATFQAWSTNAISQAELLLRQKSLRLEIKGVTDDYNYEEDWRTLVKALVSKDCHLQALDMRGHSLNIDNLNVLFKALTKGSCQLKTLMLWIPPKDTELIAKALQSPHCRLEHLIVMSCLLHDVNLGDALQSHHCKLQTFTFIDTYYKEHGAYDSRFLAKIADALKQQHCKLQNLEFKIRHTEDDEKQLLYALEFNYRCPLEYFFFNYTSPQIEQQFNEILNRNRILRQSGLADQPHVQPTTAKLFICGFSGVGKTTLRKNLLRKMALPKILQQHPSTTGMDMKTLQFGENKLVVCDLAGQKEFHAFHHHFVRGSDKDIFLIVCKAPSLKDNSSVIQFNDELRYWLRFIVSHSWLSSKPKVLIVLNYFSPFSEDKTTDARRLTRNHIDKYNGFLDFGNSNSKDSAFGVVALNPKELRLLKANIEVTLADLLQQRPKIPLLCSQVMGRIAERNLPSFVKYGPEKTKIISYDEIVQSLLDDERYTSLDNISPDTISVALSHLHDMGELIYFNEIPDIVVIDAQWFVREVIGSFITPKLIGKPLEKRGDFDIAHVRRNLLGICGLPTYVESILKCLNQMGIIFLPNDVQVLVPALLEGRLYEYRGFRNISTDIQFRGRRYECKDKEHTLLPSGIFTKLQVKLHHICCNASYHVGSGWLAFAIEDIHFCIKVGGHTDDWKDRQWIDIMIWFPINARKEIVSSKYFAIQKCIFDVCISDSSCPSISLEEHIMRFEFTKPPFDDNGKPIHVLDVEPLSRIKHEAQVNGLYYMHTWSDSTSSKIVDLLFLEELSEFSRQLQEVEKKLNSIESEVDRITGRKGPKRNTHLIRTATYLCEIGPSSNDQVCHKLDKLLEGQAEMLEGQAEMSDKLDKMLEGQEKLLEIINCLQRSIEERSKEILKQVGKSIQLLKRRLPSLPYFTDEKNWIQKYSKLLGTNVRFHLLCEAREGPHLVENQDGISMTLPPDWLVKTSLILAPAITCLTIAIRLAMAIMAGPIVPQFVPDLVNIIATEGIPSIVGTILDQKLSADYIRTNELSDNEMREFLRKVTKGTRLNMKEFGLCQVIFPGNTFAWLCEEHAKDAKDGEILESYDLDL